MALIYDEMGNVIGDDGTTPGTVASPSGGTLVTLPDGTTQSALSNVTPSNVGYFTQKAQEFQQMLYDVDATAANMMDMLDNYDLDQPSQSALQAQLAEYDSRKTALKFAAEAFNGVATMVNAVGGSLPSVNIPQTLGFAPLAIPLATAAAIAGAAVLVSWGIGWITASHTTVQSIAANISDPKLRDQVLANAAQIQARQEAGSMLGNLANIAKWIALAGAVYLGWKMFSEHKRGQA